MFDWSILRRVLPVAKLRDDAVSEALSPTRPLNLRALRQGAPMASASVPTLEAADSAFEVCEEVCEPLAGSAPIQPSPGL